MGCSFPASSSNCPCVHRSASTTTWDKGCACCRMALSRQLHNCRQTVNAPIHLKAVCLSCTLPSLDSLPSPECCDDVACVIMTTNRLVVANGWKNNTQRRKKEQNILRRAPAGCETVSPPLWVSDGVSLLAEHNDATDYNETCCRHLVVHFYTSVRNVR